MAVLLSLIFAVLVIGIGGFVEDGIVEVAEKVAFSGDVSDDDRGFLEPFAVPGRLTGRGILLFVLFVIGCVGGLGLRECIEYYSC